MTYFRKIMIKIKSDGVLPFFLFTLKHLTRAKKRKQNREMLIKPQIRERFRHIFQHNSWSSNESRSGKGSELLFTEPIRNWLLTNLPLLEVKTLLDAPCGDFNWMRETLPRLNLNYIGIDIVPEIIEYNHDAYSTKNINFHTANICEDLLPDCDLIMVRDCLIHLSFDDIEKFLNNLSKTNYKYLLTTTYLVDEGFRNTEILTGQYRKIDLFKAPFNFDKSKVEKRFNDHPAGYDKPREMILIKKQYVPSALSLELPS